MPRKPYTLTTSFMPPYTPEMPQLQGSPRPRIFNVLGGPVRKLINTLMGKHVPIEEQPPYANYYTKGYLPPFQSTHELNPYRLHAPPVPLLPDETVAIQDRADTDVQRIPDQDLQRYWNEKKAIPVPPTLVPAHGVLCPSAYPQDAKSGMDDQDRDWNYGWAQAHVPSAGRRMQLISGSPVLVIKREKTAKQNFTQDTGRAPILGKAPKVR
jgi:hypothetical protein